MDPEGPLLHSGGKSWQCGERLQILTQNAIYTKKHDSKQNTKKKKNV